MSDQTTMGADAATRTMQAFEMPEFLRSMTERNMIQARDAYQRMKTAAEEATGALEATFEKTRGNFVTLQMGALDVAKENSDATYAFMRQIFGATSMVEAIELQNAFLRERFEAYVNYGRKAQEDVTKFVAEASEPARGAVTKAWTQPTAA